jgi:predicted acetyltransferase
VSLELVRPAREHLASYTAALNRGWSPDNVLPRETAQHELRFIAEDPEGFLDALDDPTAKNGPVTFPDGSVRPRLPGFRRWMWDGELCGSIGFRWQHGTPDLPAYVLGHVGYNVVPWKRRQGVATRALGLLLVEIAPLGLPYVEVTTEPDNAGSRAVIEANGGAFVETFTKDSAYGGGPGVRYRISLGGTP